jgi:uncharacterized membrane protein YkvI
VRKKKKQNQFKNMLLIAGVFVSTIIGAGFASGREIAEFFINGGYRGIYGIVFAVVLFLLVGQIILQAIYKYDITSSDELVKLIFPKKYFGLFNLIVLGAMVSIYVVMISGVGACFNQQLGINSCIGVLFASIICGIIFMFGDDGLVKSMNFMAPIVIVGTLVISLYSLNGYVGVFNNNETKYFTIYPILYVGYNIITLIGVMPSLNKYVTSRKVAVYSSVFSSFILGVLAILISACVLFFHAQTKQIPMLYVAKTSGTIFNIAYFFILLLAMFTTSISNGYGSINVISSVLRVKNKRLCVLVFVFITFMIALMPFGNLIKYLYKFLGYVGIIELILILVFPIYNGKKNHAVH